MNVRIHWLARVEIDEGVAWYESQLAGLGEKFEDEAYSAIMRIQSNPLLFPILKGKLRRCLLVTYPYKFIYGIGGDEIFVVALAHQRRRPQYWSRRKRA
jgi:toxin ParE2